MNTKAVYFVPGNFICGCGAGMVSENPNTQTMQVAIYCPNPLCEDTMQVKVLDLPTVMEPSKLVDPNTAKKLAKRNGLRGL